MAQYEIKEVDITIECGATFNMYFTVRDDSNSLVDLTGSTVEAQLREYAEANDYLEFTATHNGAGGRVTITMPFEDTAAIPYTAGVYDVFITDTDNDRQKYLTGNVTIIPSVTKPVAGEIIYLLSFASEDDFPSYGMVRRIYFSHATNHMYRWNGTDYVSITTDGEAATVEVGDVTTLSAGSDATVENVGSLLNAVLDFGIPEGNGIDEITKTSSGLTDTYTISFTDPSAEDYSFNVTNGKGISAITKTSSGLTDTYVITYNDSTTYTMTVQNGNGITDITKTTSGLTDTYTLTFADSTTLDMVITNGKGVSSVSKTSSGLTDTYTVTWNDSTTTSYTVTNGKGIVSIEKTDTDDLVDEYTVTFNDGDTFTYTVTNGMDCTHEWDGTVLTITSASGTSSADLQGTTDYEELTNVPETFPPSSHNHDERYYTESETNTLLGAKADSSTVSTLASTVATKADASNVYTKDQMDTALAGKANSADLGDLAVKDKVDFYDDIDNLPDGYPPSPHNHDDRYYTETETDTLLSAKADASSVYTKTQTDALLADKAPVILSSASGSIASFSDGADGMPLQSLTVGIEPVQDLHGYDSPWYGGSGSNIWDEEWENGGINHTTGVNSTSTTLVRSKNYIPCQPSTAYYYVCTGQGGKMFVHYYSSEKTFLSYVEVNNNNAFTTPQDAYYIRFNMSTGYPSSYNNDIAINYPSTVTTYSPYENICPISGWTSASATRVGKNWLDPSNLVKGTFNSDTGKKTSSTTRVRTSNFIPVHAGTYTISSSANLNIVVYVYATDGTWIESESYKVWSEGYTQTITILGNRIIGIAYRYSDNSSIEVAEVTNPQMELGSTTSYEPYQTTQEITVTLPTSTVALDGTYYGGYIDPIAGTMTVTKAKVVLPASGNPPATMHRYSANGFYFKPTPYPIATGSAYYSGCYCDKLKGNTKADATTGNHFYINRYGNIYVFTKDEFDNVSAARAYLGDVTFIYPLAEPITIQLTPQQMTTLLGQNNIWTSTNGDTSVQYRADTKLFIEGQIAETMNAVKKAKQIITDVTDTMVAPKNLTSGEYIIVGDDLLKITANVASGGDLTIGTNCTKTTVAEALIALASE